MTSRPIGLSSKKISPFSHRLIRAGLFLSFVIAILASGFVWVLPVDVVQEWSVQRAGNGAFDRFEAFGKAEFFVWLVRVVTTIVSLFLLYCWWDSPRVLDSTIAAWHGLLACTMPSSSTDLILPRSYNELIRTWGCRGILVAWMFLFIGHAYHAIGERIHEWPYFRFHSGNVVLPNISDSNRAVIRYLQQETPENSQILVASDQKLFFLSYYLRPRTLLHRMHPESEHVIPLKDQQRLLNAYRLEDLTEKDLVDMPHQYTLEYFEHPDMVDRSRVLDDVRWVSFMRQRERNPSFIPAYLVRLRAVGGGLK